MKLLLIGPYPVGNNGMSEYIAQYRAEFQRQGHEVATECMYFWRNKWSLFRWVALAKRLREGFDAVMIHHTPTASGPLVVFFLRRARRLGIRTMVIGHEPPSVYAKHLPATLRPCYHAYERSVFRLASVRVTHTEFHARELRAIGVSDPIAVIPIPVYGPKPAPIGLTREQKSCWGYYGMISHKKGLDLLLDAYQSLPAGHFPQLRILGGAAPGQEDYVAALHAKVRPGYKDHIVFCGYVDTQKLAEEFARLTLAIFPYRWVSQSAALAQTCFQRIPYLAADLPYFEEFHRSYGCGALFRAGSVPSLLAALTEVRQNPSRLKDLPFDALIETLSLFHCADRILEAIAHATTAR